MLPFVRRFTHSRTVHTLASRRPTLHTTIFPLHKRFTSSSSTPKAKLLESATGRLDRARIHLRYALTKSLRPWTLDDVFALSSWLFLSQTVFILVGTTTFVSLFLGAANSLKFQEFITRKLGEQLTRETGITFVFESAIVPRWKDGKIRLGKVRIVRPRHDDVPDEHVTFLDVSVEQCDVTLNLMRWLDGKGLVESCFMKGVRGTVDQSNLSWDLQDWNPATNRQYHLDTLDFTLEGFQLEDATLSVKLPKQYKSYVLSVFQASVPNMRSKWMLYDLLSAGTVVGLFDGCLFSVHRAQRDEADMFVAAVDVDSDHEQGKIRKRQVSHLRIDGVNIEHLNAGVSGPFGWITSGTVDMSAHICFPVERTDVALKELLLKLKEKVDDITTDPERIFRKATWEDVIEEPNVPQGSPFVMDLFVRFNDIKATMPSLLSAHDVSYRDHALMRPLVGYMNWNRVSIPVQCRMALDLGKFEGAWTIYDADLPNLMSERIGLAMAKSMADERKRQQHLRRVGLWGVQSVTRNLISLWEYTGNVRTPWTSMGWL